MRAAACADTSTRRRYPIAEGSSVGFLVLVMNLVQSVWMSVTLSARVANWSLVVVIVPAICAMLLFKEELARAKVDGAIG